MNNLHQLSRRSFISTSIASSLGLLTARQILASDAKSSLSTRPNIVLIMADDLGYECIGVNGSASYQTPHLDRLARTGARMTHCHVNPLCTPTRVSLMTGRYNFRNYQAFGRLIEGEKTFANHLRDAGYATAAVGKWQLDNGDGEGQSPRQAGFDEYCLWNIEFEGRLVRDARYADPNLLYLDRASGNPTYKQFAGQYGPDICRDYLFQFMRNAVKKNQPFFAYYPMILTHNPFLPTPSSSEWTKGDRNQNDKKFFKDMVEYMDAIVGQIGAELDRLGVRDNTLLLFLGDNGTNTSIESGMREGSTVQGGKGILIDAGTHVPLIAHWPGVIPANHVIDDLIDPTDFLPTIAEAAGISLPRSEGRILDGISFYPQLKGEKGNPRECILIEYYENRKIFHRQEGRFVRSHRWKLYDNGQSPLGGESFYKANHLYDLDNDPNEQHPYLPGKDNQESQTVRKKLQSILERYKLK